jgi:hypothetical protein
MKRKAPFTPGDRIALVKMGSDEPWPLPRGTTGTVVMCSFFQGCWGVVVRWDNASHHLNLVVPPDKARRLPPAEA